MNAIFNPINIAFAAIVGIGYAALTVAATVSPDYASAGQLLSAMIAG